MSSDAVRRRDLLTRLVYANERIAGLRAAVDASDNVIHFRMERHVQSVAELLVDLNARSVAMPAAHTDERRQLARDISALENEIEFVEAKLEAARAEEDGRPRDEAAANRRAMSAQMSALRSELRDASSSDRPRPGGGSP